MKIFLSYAHQDREAANAIYLALADQRHRVFFDRRDLAAADPFHNSIRAAIEAAHLLIFLISPDAVDAGSYTLSELEIGQKAGVKILPVMLRQTEIATLPVVLQSITFYQPEGDVAAGVAAEVHRIARELRRKRLKPLALALAGAVVLAVILYAFYSRKGNQFAGKDGAPAVLIPAGSFVMGDDENSPRREIFIDAFYLDKFEVTVGRYAKFLQATGNVKAPEEWENVDPKSGADFPVVGVDWQDAENYCRWTGKRLPTEAEWEKAARGMDERKYPWGNDPPTADRARFAQPYQNPVYKAGVAPVGAEAKGASPFGIFDLSGNASEWVADWFSESFPRSDVRNPKGPANGSGKVLRGGGWYDPPERITATRRMYASPTHRSDDIGFRCAADAK
jgi:formylglycine-generating enzyme required for sulfatase activity